MSQGKAFFIGPKGQVMQIPQRHITAVIDRPRDFGIASREIEKIFNRYKEPIGHEGEAREEILIAAVNKGWIRIREWVNRQWTVEFCRATPKAKTYVRKWARFVLDRGIARDPYMPVSLIGLNDGFARVAELEVLATSSMFEHADADRWNLDFECYQGTSYDIST